MLSATSNLNILNMSATLCSICNGIFANGQILKQTQPHHRNPDDFLRAAVNGCYICRIITTSPAWNSFKVQQRQSEAVWAVYPLSNSPSGWLRLTVDCLDDESEGHSESGSNDLVESLDDGPEGHSVSGSNDLVESPDDLVPEAPAWGFVLQPVDENSIRYVANLGIFFLYLHDKVRTQRPEFFQLA
jgi:hypothetical protein